MIHLLWLSLAIPIAIHLVHRRKARRLAFSTLRFLQMVDRRVARRQRLKELLLLAARMLLLAAVVGALYHRAFGAFKGGRAQVAAAIVLDNTYSMRAPAGGVMRFGRARKAAANVLDGLQSGDVACIVPVYGPGDAADDLTGELEWLRGELEGAQCSFGAAKLGRAMRLALEALAESTAERKELYIISDLQRFAWPDAPDDAVQPEDVSVFLVDVGGGAESNLTLGRAAFGLDVHVPGLASDFYCTVGNSGSVTLEKELSLFVGGRKVSGATVEVPPGAEREVVFSREFARPGWMAGQARLGPDDLDADNARYFTVHIRELPALLVNGRPSPVSYLDETFYLERALGAAAGQAGVVTPVNVTTITGVELTGRELDDYACVILANVGEIADPRALRGYVRRGGGLIVFAGDRIVPAVWNRTLGVGPDGLLPGRITGWKDSSENEDAAPFRILDLAYRHPVFRSLADRMDTDQVAVRRFLSVTPHDQAVVLARLDGGPLLLEERAGEGTVIFCTTTGDLDWTNLPTRAGVFVPVLHQMVYHVARSLRQAAPHEVGVRLEVPAGEGKVVSWYGPPLEEGGQERLLDEDVDPEKPNVLEAARRPGIYRAVCEGDGEREGRLFAVNVDPRESDPERVSDEDAGPLLGAPRALMVRKLDRLGSLARRRREGLPLWDYLLMAAIVLAVVESFIGNVMLKR